MDTVFSPIAAWGGDTAAQVFYGLKSHVINVYGMKSEAGVPKAYQDFIRDEGIPTVLRCDNSQAQKSEKVNEINRELLVKDGWSEPYNQQQNPVELCAVQWLKKNQKILCDRCGADDRDWLEAFYYLADIHNICSDPTLDDLPPLSVHRGNTCDISPYLLFRFKQKVCYLDHEQSFPSTNELDGYWMGVAQNVGDFMTFCIYDAKTNRILN